MSIRGAFLICTKGMARCFRLCSGRQWLKHVLLSAVYASVDERAASMKKRARGSNASAGPFLLVWYE